MKALVCHRLGDPTLKDESNAPLRLTTQQPRPSEAGLKAKDIRIHVIAASLNFADALQVQVRQKPSHL